MPAAPTATQITYIEEAGGWIIQPLNAGNVRFVFSGATEAEQQANALQLAYEMEENNVNDLIDSILTYVNPYDGLTAEGTVNVLFAENNLLLLENNIVCQVTDAALIDFLYEAGTSLVRALELIGFAL